jgi:allantoin racemase
MATAPTPGTSPRDTSTAAPMTASPPAAPAARPIAKTVLVIVPFPMSTENLALRRDQLQGLQFGDDIRFEYRPVRAGPVNYSSHHDFALADISIFEAGCHAQQEGYAAVCIDTMSDSGVAALRSVLDIPVFGPGRASMLTALMLGDRFSILTMASRWKPLYKKALDELGLHHKCASVRAIEVPPDNQALLGGKESEVFPLLEAAARRAIDEDGAEVLILGSTTMHQSHAYLRERLPVPVINPGPLSYKLAEAALSLGLAHSRVGYPAPMHPRLDMLASMLDAAALSTRGR